MSVDYVVDTNVVVKWLEGRLRNGFRSGLGYAMSEITWLELMGKPGLTAQEELQRDTFVAGVSVLPIRKPIIDQAIHLRGHRSLDTADAIIAAIALHYNALLPTNDADLLRALGPMAQGVALTTGP